MNDNLKSLSSTKYETLSVDNAFSLLNQNVISICDADSKLVYFKNEEE